MFFRRASREAAARAALESDRALRESESLLARVERFEPQTARYRLDEVVLPAATRLRVEGLLSKVEHHGLLYEDWDLASVDPGGRRVAINLYGPPGTGKTMCAEGIAQRLRRQLISVSYAELESKYVGETPKNIAAAFEAARRHHALLFFDEADSILGRRLTNVTQSSDHGVNVSRSTMLLQLDRFEGVVVFASNLARNYDGAFVRRILGHVEIGLPELDQRVALLERFLRPKLPRAAELTPVTVAQRTPGLSGGELLQVVVGAATRAAQRQGAERRVELADVEAEVAALRAARRAVGLDPDSAEAQPALDPPA